VNVELQEKLEDVVDLVSKVLVNPDIELDYEIPSVAMTGESTEMVKGDPYIILKYTLGESHVQKQKIPIKSNYLKKTPEDLANLITFYIEQFIMEIESVEYGAQ